MAELAKLPTKALRQYIVVDAKKRSKYVPTPQLLVAGDESAIEKFSELRNGKITWVTLSEPDLDRLLKVASRKKLHQDAIITKVSHKGSSLPAIQSLFGTVVGNGFEYSWLSNQELVAILSDSNIPLSDVFIAGANDASLKGTTLVRGSGESLFVPHSLFQKSGDGVIPKFAQLQISDYGHTISFGAYESSSDAILYECDPAYRKRLKNLRRRKDKSFGACLRRLRLQKNVSQSGFPCITAKTIARIESGTSAKPQASTLEVIAATLGVEPDQIIDY